MKHLGRRTETIALLEYWETIEIGSRFLAFDDKKWLQLDRDVTVGVAIDVLYAMRCIRKHSPFNNLIHLRWRYCINNS